MIARPLWRRVLSVVLSSCHLFERRYGWGDLRDLSSEIGKILRFEMVATVVVEEKRRAVGAPIQYTGLAGTENDDRAR
ncbi:hypothetical protein Cni_G28962 [Canna indica]|uniref:Uncharacterized protein n=1 Tax=Canna indica TaxID=4628 RepID=A0AAQ3QTJ8_9LILI|nr:hypothetical protein Cni_G28962 [Canna indica]